jgi:diamine N-acetyltransferase
MEFTAKNGRKVILRHHTLADLDKLSGYLLGLGSETTRRYGPHPFDRTSVGKVYENPDHLGYVAEETEIGEIVAYAIIKKGYIPEDAERYTSKGMHLHPETDCTYAPCVADAWQSCGVGNALYQFILQDLKHKGIKRIILWGGVQASNLRAVNFYRKNGFQMMWEFFHHVDNYDMMLEMHR